ncbi:MAG: hypothetical protein A2X19_10675 [Bacteroidetes bacterium GWE2_39_28]|nr:MAG: hypothetical protein A2X19_10675 [Bacteroidetes bacterium GWE2_39_28]OFY13538.1 MAG: hypothetical protein A2X16_07705 [Bacteroidetes bacterium GWF2_39_10]OFZ06643.1 MAG: hypothetical protein A2322_02125 [Bacteroidetes bacterium RIFOXYB2_FULL_39_7]OFZ11697.1 MAG: hypothetical protein A2465_05710 [Bacteroidetes bacterium RIFOXYC2_FULL_39_11]HCT94872.1 hypothetical protein [Rikenellaceae bacterium]
MRASYKISLMTIAISLLTTVCAIGQVSVTGRVFAEVVESVSVKSQAITSFEILNSPDISSQEYAEGSINHSDVNLGEIKISSGSNVGCNLIITPATVSNTLGENINISPAPAKSTSGESNLTNGNQTITLKASATLNQTQVSGNYQGTYSIILAYN